jgi:predicted NAD-dependent protein-ADP-ribosyltransferase YbiA (DUF1768 family)
MIGPFNGDFRWLSNFYPIPIEYEGEVFPTLEHAYQWAKLVRPEDRRLVQLQRTPGQAKRLSVLCTCGHEQREHAGRTCRGREPATLSTPLAPLAAGKAACGCRGFDHLVAQRADWEQVLEEDWPEPGDVWMVKQDVMLDLLQRKFPVGGRLAAWLVNTGDEEIVEVNWWGDTFWGMVEVPGEDGLLGDNWLGRLLMLRRGELRGVA